MGHTKVERWIRVTWDTDGTQIVERGIDKMWDTECTEGDRRDLGHRV